MDDLKVSPPTQSDVSRRALSIARMIDRLPPGSYSISLKLPEHNTERWVVEVVQPVTVVQRKEIFDKNAENAGTQNGG